MTFWKGFVWTFVGYLFGYVMHRHGSPFSANIKKKRTRINFFSILSKYVIYNSKFRENCISYIHALDYKEYLDRKFEMYLNLESHHLILRIIVLISWLTWQYMLNLLHFYLVIFGSRHKQIFSLLFLSLSRCHEKNIVLLGHTKYTNVIILRSVRDGSPILTCAYAGALISTSLEIITFYDLLEWHFYQVKQHHTWLNVF